MLYKFKWGTLQHLCKTGWPVRAGTLEQDAGGGQKVGIAEKMGRGEGEKRVAERNKGREERKTEP